MRTILLIIAVLYCAPSVHARPQSGTYTSSDMEELRIEIDDLKHALNTTQVELGLLDERLKKQSVSLSSVKGQGSQTNSMSSISAQVAGLEKKVGHLEKTLEKAASDLRALNSSVGQTLSKIQSLETDLSCHDKRLEEVSKLKSTLTSISKAIAAPSQTLPSKVKTYSVKAGDTLEKIAKSQGVSVDAIRKINNNLQKDRIIVGQELRLPNDNP